MTPIGDYGGEMDTPRQIDDATAEALLAGRRVAAEFDPLLRVVAAYRDAAQQPVPPRGELATRLLTGVVLDPAEQHPPAGVDTNSRGLLVAATRKWRRIRMAIMTGLTVAAAKVAGASVAAKATAGIAIAFASVGTAGAAGVLPEPAQDRFNTVVESVSGPATPAPAPADDNADFGQRVSEDARDGGVDGAEISEQAREQGEQRRPNQLPTPAVGEPGKPAELPAQETPATAPTDPAAQRPAPPRP